MEQALLGCGGWIRTNDLRVMSPTSCHCSTPHTEYAVRSGNRQVWGVTS